MTDALKVVAVYIGDVSDAIERVRREYGQKPQRDIATGHEVGVELACRAIEARLWQLKRYTGTEPNQ